MMDLESIIRIVRILPVLTLVIFIQGCGALRSGKSELPAFYTLDSVPVQTRTIAEITTTGPTLIINPPQASAGFDTARIIYTREAHKLEYYARSEWIDTPARMLAPLIIAAVENTGSFRAVLLTPSAATGELRLDTEIIRLQHEINTSSSKVRFTLRAYIVENITRRVIGWRQFDETVAVNSQDPYGSVLAANKAVQSVLVKLSTFSSEAADIWEETNTDSRIIPAEGR